VRAAESETLAAGFRAKHALEAWAYELDADDPFAAVLRLTYMYNPTLRFEVGFLATGRRSLQRDTNLQVGTYGYVEARAKGRSTAAEIFAGGVFFEAEAFCVLSPNVQR
jgi:hypothetical protein